MNDNPLLGFIVIVLAMLVGYAINVIHRRKKLFHIGMIFIRLSSPPLFMHLPNSGGFFISVFPDALSRCSNCRASLFG